VIALHRDPLVARITDVRRTREVLRRVRPLPLVELCVLEIEERRLLREDAWRRRC
jgi:hypothetical protein